jgi:two-component system nitrogen regulation response regulator NtrX
VDVRVIAATNKDLLQEVDEKNFRLDLYHRSALSLYTCHHSMIAAMIFLYWSINSWVISAPIMALPKRALHREALDALKEHNWTGNIRELRNVVERLIILSGKNHQ